MEAAKTTLRLLEELRKIDPEMQLQTASVFLYVAHNEGITMKDLGDQLGLAQSSCSRNVAYFSKINRKHKEGYDLLVAREDPAERRRKLVYLTPKGRRIVESLGIVLDGYKGGS